MRCCSGVRESQTAGEIEFTSLLSSAYQRRTYRMLASARGVSVKFGEPLCKAQG